MPLFLIIIFLVAVVQSSFYPFLEINDLFPNLILIITLILTLLSRKKEVFIWIIFGGLCLDIFSFNNFLGLSVAALFLVYLSALFLKENIFQSLTVGSILLIGIINIFINRFFLVLILKTIGQEPILNFGQIISEIIYSLIVLLPLFYGLKHILKNKKTAIF